MFRKKMVAFFFLLLAGSAIFLTGCDTQTGKTNIAPSPTTTYGMIVNATLPPVPTAPPSYTIVAQFHGKGSRTITHLSLPVTKAHRIYFVCLNGWRATVAFTPPQGGYVSPTAMNDVPCTVPLQPQNDMITDNVGGRIQQVTVTVDDSAIWNLQLMNCDENRYRC